VPTVRRLILGGVVAILSGCSSPPNDDLLILHFESHRVALHALSTERLANPSVNEVRMAYDITARPPTARLVSQSSMDPPPASRALYLTVYSRSFYHAGVAKGFAFLTGPPRGTMVSTLDGRQRSDGEAFRKLEGNWYLFFEPR
jgi:hypothetical protein